MRELVARNHVGIANEEACQLALGTPLEEDKADGSGKRGAIEDGVDRVGAGNAFAADPVYGLRALGDDGAALEFATAASRLKHSLPGDFNWVDVADVNALVKGDVSGRVQR